MSTKQMTIALLLVLAGARPAWAGNFELSWYTVDGGGGSSAGGSFALSGSAGQPDAGTMSGGTFTLQGGFWPGVAAATVIVFGDCDGDGHVDLDDHADLAACLSGPGGGLAPGCECFDADVDNDVDLGEFAAFQANFSGS